ncbi:hypothetical protein [Pseudobacteriovorax antillogorgiicola]|uniref:Tetratricopeptide repeat-containing protein n=1 Tax=Pseudobacteriovorax antillogorgiicola TaxID=1513793 RepID=A0A1Y6CBJ8_9BACT|nr:hypothetical protein [Pseudobacteriovorax antillogorgiicola]TCS48688.1 hypothetical protein EDD56_117110 [Pseudobacteriovorax antillogorgiicola]SMF54797.1 hypothetical protein SAMN06296036_11749 [Pseudobacteriovorax antillogorgiicola]
MKTPWQSNIRATLKFLLVGISVSLFLNQVAFGLCASLIKGTMAFNVTKCGRLSPEKTFNNSRLEKLQFIKDLTMEDRKTFFDSYRGLVIEGLVVRSLAVRSGLTPEKGALNGQNITVYIPPGPVSCQQILNKRIKTLLDEACCEGGGEAPCLLNTTYVFKNISVLGPAQGGAGNAKRMKLAVNKTFLKANNHLKRKQFSEAVTLYEQLRSQKLLDTRGHYFLSYSYRMLDQCPKAIPVLEIVHKKSEANSYWANEEGVIKKAILLYARCLSKTGRSGESVLVLQGFLANPKRFKEEIKASLVHGDFGRSRTTKEFQQYMQDAQKALSRAMNPQ